MPGTKTLVSQGKHWINTHQIAAVFTGIVLALILAWVGWRLIGMGINRLSRLSGRVGQAIRSAQAKTGRPQWRVEDVLTALIALTATTYAGTGNWQFLSKATHYGVDLKAVLVWVFEGAVVVEGLRARRNILNYGEAGIDGRGLWIFAAASSVLSVSEASGVPEALARLMVPLIAAFLWERLMKAPLDAVAMAAAKERREAMEKLAGGAKTKRRISWRVRPERIVVWLGLADSADTTTLAAESNRRIMRYVKAAERADRVAAGDKTHRLPWTAQAREARAERKLTAHGLLSYADPTEVYERLSRQKMAATLKRLGVDAGPESGSAESESGFQPDDKSGPELVGTEVPARIPEWMTNPDLDPALVGGASDDGWSGFGSSQSTTDDESGFRIPTQPTDPDSLANTAPQARMSDPDSEDRSSDPLPTQTDLNGKPTVAAVVRNVYRDEWDTATIQRVVADVLPDARPDTIQRTIKKIRTERSQNPSPDSTVGGYL